MYYAHTHKQTVHKSLTKMFILWVTNQHYSRGLTCVFFILSTSFCSLSSWFTSSCAHHLAITVFVLTIYHSLPQSFTQTYNSSVPEILSFTVLRFPLNWNWIQAPFTLFQFLLYIVILWVSYPDHIKLSYHITSYSIVWTRADSLQVIVVSATSVCLSVLCLVLPTDWCCRLCRVSGFVSSAATAADSDCDEACYSR